jgi:hypothetical protein
MLGRQARCLQVERAEMPKEYLLNPQPLKTHYDLDGGNPHPAPWVEPVFGVTWVTGEAGHAQLFVTIDRKQFEAIMASEGHDIDGTITIYSDTLSRYELNKDVKNLRKVRDQVHGADE